MSKSMTFLSLSMFIAATLSNCNTSSYAPPSVTIAKTSSPQSRSHKIVVGKEVARVETKAIAMPSTAAAPKRKIVYSADLRLVVERIDEAQSAARQIATELEGFVQQQSGADLHIKVPVAQFPKALDQLEKIGAVASKEVKGEDITEKMNDLESHLRSAERVRDILEKLLNDAVSVEDALKIQKELAAATEKIELYKGKIRFYQHHADYSSIRIRFNVPRPPRAWAVDIPFPWVRGLGRELMTPTPDITESDESWFFKIRVDLPAGFVKYREDRDLTRALSGDGIRLKLARHENIGQGDLSFWTRMLRRGLIESAAIAVGAPEELRLDNGAPARILSGRRRIGQTDYAYAVVLTRTDDHVYAFEAWGKAAAFPRSRDAIVNAAKTLRP